MKIIVFIIVFCCELLFAADIFEPPSLKVISAASKRINIFQVNRELYDQALKYLKLRPLEDIKTRVPFTEKKLTEEIVSVGNYESTTMAIGLSEDEPVRTILTYDHAASDFIDSANLIPLGTFSARQIADLIYPNLPNEEFSQKFKYTHVQAIRDFNITIRSDDLKRKSQREDKVVFKLLPHFDRNGSASDFFRPFDVITVIAMEAHGFGKQTMQIGLTRRSNIETGAVINEDQVYMTHEIEIGDGIGYTIIQRQLPEDEWVIVHTASPIYEHDVLPQASRCMMVINTRLYENTDVTCEYNKFEALSYSRQ